MVRKCFLGIFCYQVNSVHIQTFFLTVKYFLIVTLYFKVWENSKLEEKKNFEGGKAMIRTCMVWELMVFVIMFKKKKKNYVLLSNGMCDTFADQ